MRKHASIWFLCFGGLLLLAPISGAAASFPSNWTLTGSSMLLVPGNLKPEMVNDATWTATFADDGLFAMHPVGEPEYTLTGSYTGGASASIQAQLDQTVAENVLKSYLQEVVDEQVEPGETVTVTGVTLTTARTIMIKQSFANQTRLMVMIILMGRATAEADGENLTASVMAMIRLSGSQDSSLPDVDAVPQVYDLPMNVSFTGIGVASVSAQLDLTLYLGPNDEQGLAANQFAIYGEDDYLGVIDFVGTFNQKGAIVTLGGLAEGLANPFEDAVWSELENTLPSEQLALVKDVRLSNLRSMVIAPPGQDTMTVMITGMVMVDIDMPLFDISKPVGLLLFRGQAKQSFIPINQ